jgi:hypothetical protein
MSKHSNSRTESLLAIIQSIDVFLENKKNPIINRFPCLLDSGEISRQTENTMTQGTIGRGESSSSFAEADPIRFVLIFQS